MDVALVVRTVMMMIIMIIIVITIAVLVAITLDVEAVADLSSSSSRPSLTCQSLVQRVCECAEPIRLPT